jgi:hypothetical protein
MIFAYFLGCASPPVVQQDIIDVGEETHEISEPVNEEVFEEDDFQTNSYAMLMVVGREIEDPSPISSEWGKQQTSSLALLSWDRSDTDVEYMETHCLLSTTDDFGTVYNYTNNYLEAISDRTRIGVLSSTQTGAEFTVSEYIDLNGVELDNPIDPLPTTSSDSRIYDMDGDGHIGITIGVSASIGSGEVYAVQRRRHALNGIVINNERIEGYVSAVHEQVSLDFSEFWLEYGNSEGRVDTDTARSYFIIQEIDSSWGCSEIIANQNSLF